MINIKYEVVIKYNGDILNIKKKSDVDIEILSPSYAIMTSPSVENIESLLYHPQVEQIEEPFILDMKEEEILFNTEINNFKNRNKLSGKGTLLGIISSGIDYNLPVFKDANGKSKILYYYDQSVINTPLYKLKKGMIYNNDDINNAINHVINNKDNTPIYSTSDNGTSIASICSEIANEANLIFVRVGNQEDNSAKSTEIMRAIKFIINKSIELKMPVAISINYTINEKYHRNTSLFEQYLEDMCLFGKNNIVVPFLVSHTKSRVIAGTPHIAGICSLLLQWGVINNNDPVLYSIKLKELILKSIRASEKIINPKNLVRYESLNLSELNLKKFLVINKLNSYKHRKKTKMTKKRKSELKNSNYSLSRRPKNINGINIFHRGNFEEEMKLISKEIEFYKICDNFGVIFINENNYNTVLKAISLPSVISYEPTVMLASLSEISQGTNDGVNANEEIGANYLKNNANLSLTGRGVLIAIIGSGIDYLHPDFIYPDGTSKILFLWDQTKEGNPPNRYFIGTEYTRNQINEAISKNDGSLSFDEDGSGTMNAGICSGLGNLNSQYKGIAEDSDLIVVKMDKINGSYNNAMYFAAYQYAIQKSIENKMPIVINESYGNISYSGLYTRAIFEDTFYIRGICTVTAAGNEGDTQTHTTGQILFKGDTKEVNFVLTNDEEEIQIQIWMDKPDIVKASIMTPTGELTRKNVLSNYSIISGLLDIEQTKYEITNIYPTSYSGQQQISIKLTNLKKGIWKIRLEGEYITNGIYNVYLPNRAFIDDGTRFLNPDPDQTTTYPSTIEDNITVGAYNIINNSLWQGTSRGPAISGHQKPDILAPGVNIVAPYPDNEYAMITGTAAAASYTSGCVALLLQYLLSENIYPDKGFVQKIRTYLRIGATRDNDIIYPNNLYGFGYLNVRNTFEQIR